MPSRLPRLLVFLVSRRSSAPWPARALATWWPTNPVAPVRKTFMYRDAASRFSPKKARPASRLIQGFRLEGNALLAGCLPLVVLPHPVPPLLAGGAVLAGEFDCGDLGVAHLPLLRGAGREILHAGAGEGRPRPAVEDVRLDALAAFQHERHVAAVVEGLLEGPAQVVVCCERRDPALQVVV